MPWKKISPLSSFLISMADKKNLVSNYKKSFEMKEKFDLFLYGWNILMMAESEEDFVRLFGQLNEDFHEFPKELEYVKNRQV